jgi:hypothetical protein
VGAEIASYDGAQAGARRAYVPMLFKNAFGGSYDAAFYVQNVDPANLANITINFYDSQGSLTCFVPDTLPPLASKGYWLPDVPCLPDGWVGGAVITSDFNIVSVGRPHVGTEIMTYNGFSSGSLNAYLPMLFKNAWGSYNSAFYVQNVDDANTAHLTIQYYDSAGSETCSMEDTVEPLASKGYWVPAQSCLPDGWVGGVKVTADHSIVAVGRPHIGEQVTTYPGMASGGTNQYLPMLFKNAFGGSYDSAFYIQNSDTLSPANVMIRFYDTNGDLSCTRSDSIPPKATLGYWLPSLTCEP